MREYRETGPHGTWEPWNGEEEEEEEEEYTEEDYYVECGKCFEPIDYCLGHGTI